MNIVLSIHHELNSNSGAAGVTLRLAEALRKRGHTVDILSFEMLPGRDRWYLKRFVFPWLVARYVVSNPKTDVFDLSSGDGWIINIIKRFRKSKTYSTVFSRSHGLEHIHHENLLREKSLGLTKISWKYPIYNGGFRLWECKQSFVLADGAFFLNKEDRIYAIEKLKVAPNKAHLVKNGINQIFLMQARNLINQRCAPVNFKRIAFIGRYSISKGCYYLKQAMLNIFESHPDVMLSCFGTGLTEQEILNDYPVTMHNRINVVSSYHNDKLPSLLLDHHILAFPSMAEGMPVAPLEAMACGLVPIVANIPGPTAYVEHEVNGLIVPVADSLALKGAIIKLLDNDSLFNKLRQNALQDVLKFSWDLIAKETEEIYMQGINMVRNSDT